AAELSAVHAAAGMVIARHLLSQRALSLPVRYPGSGGGQRRCWRPVLSRRVVAVLASGPRRGTIAGRWVRGIRRTCDVAEDPDPVLLFSDAPITLSAGGHA